MQHFVDLQNSSNFGDSDSWLSSSSTAVASAPNSNLNRDLFNDLVEIVPLVQSL
ncbi:paramyosin-like, partial [Trifolium medium]|nr:paramyosin-like [Trifolium medium]